MYLQYIYSSKFSCRTSSFLLIVFCLLTIAGLGFICYDNDLSDSNDPPVIALRYPVLFYAADDVIALLPLISESIDLPFINKNPFLSRAPPTEYFTV
jgi:hypothetical protein